MGLKSSKSKKKEDARITQSDRAVLELKLQRDKLYVYKKKLAHIMDREQEIARQLLKEGKKKPALLALRKRRAQAKMIESTDQKISKLEEWINSVEDAQRDKQIFDAMQAGKEALEEMNREVSLEAVEQLLLETQDAMDMQRQIEEALVGKLDSLDEKAMEAELERMMEQEGTAVPAKEKDDYVFPTVPNTKDEDMFPAVPAHVPEIAGSAEEEEEEEEEDVPPPPPAQLAAA